MTRGLRFASLEVMPPALQTLVHQADVATVHASLPARCGAADPRPARKPRKDAEHTEQVVFFNRIRTLALNEPRYRMAADRTFAIPNGGGRSKREAGRLKAEGVRAGVSDIFVSVARGSRHGLYIEMKSLIGVASREQKDWIAQSLAEGYAAAVTRGADEALRVWLAYVDGRETPP